MAKIKAKLRNLSLRGETTSTRWGSVSFDRDGLAELEVPEGDLQMLRDMKPHSWLAEDQLPKALEPAPLPQEVPVVPPADPEAPPAPAAPAGSEEPPPLPPAAESDKAGFDTSDSEAPSGKKSGKKGR